MRCAVRAIFCLLLSLTFWAASNHCFLESFAHAVELSTHVTFTHDAATHSHRHSHGAEHDQATHDHSNPHNHSGSEDSCCQSMHVLPASGTLVVKAPQVTVIYPLLVPAYSLATMHSNLAEVSEVGARNTGPPRELKYSVSLLALSLSPNAPPSELSI